MVRLEDVVHTGDYGDIEIYSQDEFEYYPPYSKEDYMQYDDTEGKQYGD